MPADTGHASNSSHISAFDRWLVVIGVLKLGEALLFIVLGVGLLRMLHKDLVDEATRMILALRFDPEGRLASIALDKLALISPHRLKLIGAAAFVHAALDILEGVGLVLRTIWGEYVTIIVSAFFLPFEIFELVKRVTWVRVGITTVNVAVVVYLIFHLQMKIRERMREANSR
jgi:uncharacterized membrane protein (DUF2068 family)